MSWPHMEGLLGTPKIWRADLLWFLQPCTGNAAYYPSPDSECHCMGGADTGTMITAQARLCPGTGQMLPSVELQLCGGIFQALCALQ